MSGVVGRSSEIGNPTIMTGPSACAAAARRSRSSAAFRLWFGSGWFRRTKGPAVLRPRPLARVEPRQWQYRPGRRKPGTAPRLRQKRRRSRQSSSSLRKEPRRTARPETGCWRRPATNPLFSSPQDGTGRTRLLDNFGQGFDSCSPLYPYPFRSR